MQHLQVPLHASCVNGAQGWLYEMIETGSTWTLAGPGIQESVHANPKRGRLSAIRPIHTVRQRWHSIAVMQAQHTVTNVIHG